MAHHGGVGTLQAGLLAGCPTLVCPVYGDQFWWGEVVHRAGVGPAPLPAHHLTCASLAKVCLRTPYRMLLMLKHVCEHVAVVGTCFANVHGA